LRRRTCAGPPAPEQGADPGEQLGKGEWLHQVVVGASLEPVNAVLEVEGLRAGAEEAVFPRSRQGAVVAFGLEPVLEGACHLRFVFDDKDPHRDSPGY
jgi:hypothetical protein